MARARTTHEADAGKGRCEAASGGSSTSARARARTEARAEEVEEEGERRRGRGGTHSMLALASRSLPSRATRGRLMIVWRRAHSEKMSATGLRPVWWESVSERSRGREARGGRVRGSERRERTLVGRAQDRVRRPRDTLGVRDGGPALERVEEDVEAGRDVDLARARVGVERVDDAEERAHGARGDARLGREVRKVGDGRAGRLRGGEGGREGGSSEARPRCESPSASGGRDKPVEGELEENETHLTARSCGGRHSDERAQRLLDRLALADGRVDEVVQVGVRVDREEVGDFLQALREVRR